MISAKPVQWWRPTARSAKRLLAIVILSVRLSVATGYRFKPRWDRDSGFSPDDSVESLVSCDQISCRWVRRFLSNEDITERYPLRNRYFTAISSTRIRTVADRHRLGAYHNKHCSTSFPVVPTSTTLNDLEPLNRGFSEFLAILGCDTHFKSELRRNHWR